MSWTQLLDVAADRAEAERQAALEAAQPVICPVDASRLDRSAGDIRCRYCGWPDPDRKLDP